MGSPKQLLPYGGRPLLRHAVETALATRCGAVVVVLGANSARVAGVLAGLDLNGKVFWILENSRWAEGMGTSIHAGLRRAEEWGAEGVLLALADQPLVTAAALDNLVAEHERTGSPVVASRYSGTVGVPVWFSRSHFPQLMALAPNQGCKGVILETGAAAALIDCPEAAADIDTPADYEALRP